MAAHAHLIASVAPDKLAAITDESWDELWHERLSADTSAPSTLVAEQGGEIVGIAFWQASDEDDLDPSSVVELKVLYVTPSAWGSGIGRRLVEAAFERMRSRVSMKLCCGS
jgi:GNAT superfamily N-acetyltransferase